MPLGFKGLTRRLYQWPRCYRHQWLVLQLNEDKTELLWFGPASQLRHLSSDNLAIALDRNAINPSSVVRDGRAVRHWAINAPSRFAYIADVLVSPRTPSVLISSSTWPWRTLPPPAAFVWCRRDHWNAILVSLAALTPSPLLDDIRVMVIVWRLRGNIIRIVLCWIVWHNVRSLQHTYVSSSYRLTL